MSKIILIGQAPGRRGDPAVPLASPRLAKLCGLTMKRYLERAERRNLLELWPGKQTRGKGDVFPRVAASRAAAELIPVLKNRKVIFLGQNVARAFAAPDAGLFEWFVCGDLFASFEAAVVPHPSGVNKWYNEPQNRRKAAKFLRTALKSNG